MKMEVNNSENKLGDGLEEVDSSLPSCEVAIDISQVLSANQALLKNMARKMDCLEEKISKMEAVFQKQAFLLESYELSKKLLLPTPVRTSEPWKPCIERLDSGYYKKFTLFDKFFRPWVMRREDDVHRSI